MIKLLRTIVPSILLFVWAMMFAQLAQSDYHEIVETPSVIESFVCDYKNGKDAGDLDSAVSYWQSQVDKIDSADLKNYFAAVIKPIRSNNSSDFYWLGAFANLNAFARGTAAYAASKEGQAADARFEKMSTCVSNLYFSEMLYAGTPPQEGNNDFVLEGYACKLKKGKTMSNAMAVEQSILNAAKAIKSPINVYRWTPFLSGQQADVVYLVGHDDLVTFGSSNTSLLANPSAAINQYALSTVMDCSAGLFMGEVIHTGPPPTE